MFENFGDGKEASFDRQRSAGDGISIPAISRDR